MKTEVDMAEYAELLNDRKRLNWCLPILSLADGPTDERALKICGALMLGKAGREALDAAMEGAE